MRDRGRNRDGVVCGYRMKSYVSALGGAATELAAGRMKVWCGGLSGQCGLWHKRAGAASEDDCGAKGLMTHQESAVMERLQGWPHRGGHSNWKVGVSWLGSDAIGRLLLFRFLVCALLADFGGAVRDEASAVLAQRRRSLEKTRRW